MEIRLNNVRVAQISELRKSYELDEAGNVVLDVEGRPAERSQWREVTFDDGRIVPELYGPFKVFGPAERFPWEVGSTGELTLRLARRMRKDDGRYYMAVDIVNFEPVG